MIRVSANNAGYRLFVITGITLFVVTNAAPIRAETDAQRRVASTADRTTNRSPKSADAATSAADGPHHREEPVAPPPAGVVPMAQRVEAPRVWSRASFTSVQVNVAPGGGNIVGDAANEPSMAIDPTNRNRIAIGWRQFDTIADDFRQAGVAYSTDGGQTWTFPGVLDPGQFRSDPVLSSDADGIFYYSSLSSLTTVEVFRSADGGMTWTSPVPAFGGDKQWMNADRTAGAGSGNLYQIWNVQFSCCGQNDWTRSTNGGASFIGPYAVPQPSMKWGTLDVDPDGTLYLAGALLIQTGHVLARSSDAQDPFVTPTFDFVSSIDVGGRVPGGNPNPAGLLGQVWVATDHSTGPSRGNVYVLSSINPPDADPCDVHFIRSTDGGVTWSPPIRVNNDPVGNGAWQWFGTMSVAPNGRIDVVWNDTRNTGASNLSELYYAFSTDTGVTWSANLPVSPAFDSHLGWPQQNKIGDYYHMISDNGGASLAYAATFNGEQDVYFLRIETDCNENGVADFTEIETGASPDCNNNGRPDECDEDCQANGVPDDCECIPIDAPTAEVGGVGKMRYLSIVPPATSCRTALRVTLESLPSPFESFNGATLWVSEPRLFSESGGSRDPMEGFSNFTGATLQCAPLFRDWSDVEVLQVFHQSIVPGGVYAVRAIDEGCEILSESNFSPALTVSSSRWGDVAGAFGSGGALWPAPDGSVDVVTDALAVIDKFRGVASAPIKARADVEPSTPDQLVNITDATRVLDAFRGLGYPFAGPAGALPCP